MKFGPLFGLSTAPVTIDEAIADIRLFEEEGAHGVCLHLNILKPEYRTEENFHKLFSSAHRVELYAACYRGGSDMTDDERAEILLMAARNGADIVDVMGDLFDPVPGELTVNLCAVEKQKALVAKLKLLGVQVLMSSHVHLPMKAEEVFRVVSAHRDRGANIAKIVPNCDTEEELAESRRANGLLREKLGIPFVHVCGGEMGKKFQRYETILTGGAITFVKHNGSDSGVQPMVSQALEYLRAWTPWAASAERRELGEFSGRVAVITGAASGMGLLASKRLAALGASVVMVDINGEALNEKIMEIRASGGTAFAMPANVRKYEDAEKTADKALELYGRIDILLCFAGGYEPRCCNSNVKFYEQPREVIDWGLEVNLHGPVYFSRACMPAMIRQNRGVIVCLGSVSGVEASADGPMYGTSKSGLFYFVKCLALAGAPHNVRAVCVAPGPVMTRPGMAGMHTPMERAAEPIEVVNLILYLCSDKASFISGSTHFIDGARSTNFGK